MKQFGILLCALVLAALPVLAQGDGAGEKPREGKGRPEAAALKPGTLTATGTGLARIMLMKGTATIEGAGDLLVRGTLTVEIQGEGGVKADADEAAVAEFLGERAQQGRGPAEGAGNGPRADGAGGEKAPAKQTAVIYKGFNGTLTIKAERNGMFAVRGENVKITVQGNGNAMLIGEGAYTSAIEGGEAKEGAWFVRPKEGERPKPGTRPQMIPIGETPQRPGGEAGPRGGAEGEGKPKPGPREGAGEGNGKGPREGKGPRGGGEKGGGAQEG